ncbi:MAG: glycine--tRNA ligase subunit beta, partial [Pigmentiphaga sp.]
MSSAPLDAQPLLVELLTEELPPRALQRLGTAFAAGIEAGLREHDLLADGATATAFATPRRLAVRLSAVRGQAPDRAFREKLMPVKVGLTEHGEATPALRKKLATKGWQDVDPARLLREHDGKQESLVYEGMAQGANLAAGLQAALDAALAGLPIPKTMTYQLADGETTVRFVRPAHRLVALHGGTVVPVTALGLTADRLTQGHRFQASQEILSLADATGYEHALAHDGAVIASYEARRALIDRQLRARASELGASLGDETDVAILLDEVTALVERPAVYVGEFEPDFLDVPPECLILTMRLNQKYFPLFDAANGQLSNRFLIVSNMMLDDPANIVQGNQRVVRPRLADARFFFETDLKATLASRLPMLEAVVYHNRLGTQLERSRRVARLAQAIAGQLGLDAALAERAALLAKVDLVTQMVGEFPELQGIMGAYYASHDGEPEAVVAALRQQYQIRLDAPVDAGHAVGAVLFLAERLETLAGIWAIGQLPSGDRDPFGLRRAALGVISAFEQLAAGGYIDPRDPQPALTLEGALTTALEGLGEAIVPAAELSAVRLALRDFIHERYRNQLLSHYERPVIDAVLAVSPALHQVPARVAAVAAFQLLPEAASLAAANKRIGYLLKKASNAASEL